MSQDKPISNMVQSLKEWFDNATPEQLEEAKHILKGRKDSVPKGWVSIDEHLPMMKAKDFMCGTTYRVMYFDGTKGTTIVSDHNVWVCLAKDEGITHWYNGDVDEV